MARFPTLKVNNATTVPRDEQYQATQILNELSDGRERSVSELEGVIASLSQSALSQHLARLRRANIGRTRRRSPDNLLLDRQQRRSPDTQTSRPYTPTIR